MIYMSLGVVAWCAKFVRFSESLPLLPLLCPVSVPVWGGGGGQLVRCGPATVAPAAPAPRPSLLSQFITCSSGQWPCLCSKQFHVPASLAGVRAVGGRVYGVYLESP